MPTTTTYGYRIPLDSDPVESGAEAIRNLAADIVTKLRARQRGQAVVPVAASTIGTVVVNFPEAYAAAPNVVLTSVNTSVWHVYISAISATSVTIGARQIQGTSTTANVAVNWQAEPA